MDLLLFRHAEKDPFGPDPLLTTRGEEQARRLPAEVSKTALGGPILLLSSPKRRAIETLRPLASAWELALTVDPALDERHRNETHLDFKRRVGLFIESLAQRPEQESLILCSHLDWIEEFRTRLECAEDLTRFPFDHWPSSQSLHLRRESPQEPWRVVKMGRSS